MTWPIGVLATKEHSWSQRFTPDISPPAGTMLSAVSHCVSNASLMIQKNGSLHSKSLKLMDVLIGVPYLNDITSDALNTASQNTATEVQLPSLRMRFKFENWSMNVITPENTDIITSSIFLVRAFLNVPPCCSALRLHASWSAHLSDEGNAWSLCCNKLCICFTKMPWNAETSIS